MCCISGLWGCRVVIFVFFSLVAWVVVVRWRHVVGLQFSRGVAVLWHFFIFLVF